MKKYKDRYLRKIAKAINIAYLATAIFCGYATYELNEERKDLKENYSNDQISYDEFLEKSQQASEREEEVFKFISICFGVTSVSDIAFQFATKDKDL